MPERIADKVRVEPEVIWEHLDDARKLCRVVLHESGANPQKKNRRDEWYNATWAEMPVARIIADLASK